MFESLKTAIFWFTFNRVHLNLTKFKANIYKRQKGAMQSANSSLLKVVKIYLFFIKMP